MRKQVQWAAVVLFAAVVSTGIAALFASPAHAGPKCWQVDCNTCCRGVGGGVEPQNPHRPSRRLEQAGQALDRGGLARPVRADKSVETTPRDFEVDSIHRRK